MSIMNNFPAGGGGDNETKITKILIDHRSGGASIDVIFSNAPFDIVESADYMAISEQDGILRLNKPYVQPSQQEAFDVSITPVSFADLFYAIDVTAYSDYVSTTIGFVMVNDALHIVINF